MLLFGLYWALALFCWGYALALGGAPARFAFALFLAAMVASSISTEYLHRDNFSMAWSGLNVELLITDLVYFLGLYALAIVYRRYWLIWSAGLQLICTLTHFGPFLDPGTNAKLYRGLETVWMLPMLVTMVLGIARDRAHARKRIEDRHTLRRHILLPRLHER